MSLQSFINDKFTEIKSERERSNLETNIKFGLLNNRFDLLSHDVENLLDCFHNIHEKLIGNISSRNNLKSSCGVSSHYYSSSSEEGNSDEKNSDRLRRSKRKRGEDDESGRCCFDPLATKDSENFTSKTVDDERVIKNTPAKSCRFLEETE